jgi:hypothetical protein
MWYHPMKKDVDFIIGFSRRGDDCHRFPDPLPSFAGENQLEYELRYVILDIISPLIFQVPSVHMWMRSFHREDFRFLCLTISTLSHSSFDVKHISFPFMHYVHSLV